VVVLFFPYAFNQIGKAVTFGFLAAMAIAQAAVTWLWVPEPRTRLWRKSRGLGWEKGQWGPPLPPNERGRVSLD
jgi:hypothetical protein